MTDGEEKGQVERPNGTMSKKCRQALRGGTPLSAFGSAARKGRGYRRLSDREGTSLRPARSSYRRPRFFLLSLQPSASTVRWNIIPNSRIGPSSAFSSSAADVRVRR
ncbi:Hypothetical protein NTJ_00115 [Nesidiocoris tenuis]|uniref:Uncharacterized protein n=1 Tax=Nesidiocoris tenuis TaxID=355587 RepID=A0ABN7A555_9HEMI|nr:Hypothetical protein NTJ_00115 [Nesidiocoris tenuis]